MNRILPVMILTGLLGVAALTPMSASAEVAVGVSVNIGPPALPYYPQPFCPGPGYIWTPGYWAYGADGYYWVPGTWVFAPAVGVLWTPGYWGWRGGFWWWHPGYWGPHVGFYGGIAYGYGYFGHGFVGGYWHGNAYYYNRSVTQVNVSYVHNTYVQAAPPLAETARVSYNGGTGGVTAAPTAEETRYASEQHMAPTGKQVQHQQQAMNNPGQRFSANQGHPDVAATARPTKFNGNGAVRTNESRDAYDYHPGPRNMGAPRQPRAMQPRERAPRERRPGGRPPRQYHRR